MERILDTDVKILILRFRRTHLLASTGVVALNQMIRTARKKNDEIRDTLESGGVIRKVGPSRTFIASDIIFDSTQRALEKAKEILKKSNEK